MKKTLAFLFAVGFFLVLFNHAPADALIPNPFFYGQETEIPISPQPSQKKNWKLKSSYKPKKFVKHYV